jgi:hypothetical protein
MPYCPATSRPCAAPSSAAEASPRPIRPIPLGSRSYRGPWPSVISPIPIPSATPSASWHAPAVPGASWGSPAMFGVPHFPRSAVPHLLPVRAGAGPGHDIRDADARRSSQSRRPCGKHAVEPQPHDERLRGSPPGKKHRRESLAKPLHYDPAEPLRGPGPGAGHRRDLRRDLPISPRSVPARLESVWRWEPARPTCYAW